MNPWKNSNGKKVDDDKNIWKDNGLSTLDDSYDIIDTQNIKVTIMLTIISLN